MNSLFTGLLTWAESNTALLSIVSLVSLTLLLVSIFLTPWLVSKLPANYFDPAPSARTSWSLTRLVIFMVRNAIGLTLMLVGLLMIFVPGPGVVTLLAGLSVCDFSAKHRVIQHLVSQPNVLKTLNWMRKKHGKPPFNPLPR